MVVLHLAWFDGNLVLWGESPREAAGAQAPAHRGRNQVEKTAVASYPFGAAPEVLEAALRDAGVVVEAKKAARRGAMAWLPMQGSVPIASSPLVAEAPQAQGEIALAPWRVEAIALTPEQAVDLLCRCGERPTLAPGVLVGRDVAFWAQALRLAAALVARQQYLPGVESRDSGYRACWEPVFAGPDAERVAALAKTMPAVSRALGAADAPAAPASEAVRQFLGATVDHLVRSAASGRAVEPSLPRRGRPRKKPAFDSVHDQWLYALRSADGLLEGDEAELAQLAEQVREWRRPLSVSVATPFRLCFRLEEPRSGVEIETRRAREPGDAWRVRFLLQASDDPSLLVPAEDAWAARGRAAAVLRRAGYSAQEHLLSSLGQAAGICPRIEAALKTQRPAGYELDTTGAHEFLTQRSLLLEQAGFGVLLPAWWTRTGTKLRLNLRANVKSPKMQGGGGLSLDEVVHVDWEVALGDERLSPEELEALARLKAPLVQVRGQWVQVNAAEIQAALEFWRKKGAETLTARQVVQMALGATDAVAGIPLAGIEADGWMGDVLRQLDGRAEIGEVPVPQGFVGTLRPYQARGYAWLAFLRQWGLGACLADDMGLGKTIQALALFQRDWESNGKRPVLLICPTSVVSNWQKEAERFTPGLPVMVHHGLERKRGEDFVAEAQRHALVVSSYALLHRDIEHLQKVPWLGIILDEAQNIKNPETKQARAARSLATDYRVALTGTPVENNVGDLWSLMEFLNPGFLGSQAGFKREFFIPIQTNRDPEVAARLRRLTGPFILRRLKTDKSIIADLPEKQEMKVFCTLTKEQASLYAAVVKDAESALEGAEGIQRKGVVLATLSKLKQVCNHPAQFLGDRSAIPGRSGKLARLAEMLDEALEVGDRALVFTQFAEMGGILKRHLEETFGREALFLHGAVPKAQRDRMVERFQGDGGPPLFILSLKAGGTGLNLTRANHVFHFDRWWNPAVENQATDRAFRIGQTRNVQVHKFLCAGTLEEKIDEMIERKKEVAEKVVGTGEGWLTEFSNRQLKELFALRAEAIGE